MWLPVVGILMAVAGLMVVNRKRRGLSPQTHLSPEQVLNLATQVKGWSGHDIDTGYYNKMVELFGHLGLSNGSRVATMAMSLGGDPVTINSALHAGQS